MARSLGSVLSQTYPVSMMEVIVVDGVSDDDTAVGVSSLVERANSDTPGSLKPFAVTLLENPGRIVPSSLNLALEVARGEVIIRIDGHCEIDSDYVDRCVALLDQTGADCAGGVIVNVGEGFLGRCIALAQASRFGVGPVAFRTKHAQGRYVDTLAFGAYRRKVFDEIGVFDEELVRNQDDEFNFRLVQHGGRIWLDPSTQVRYFSRPTLRGLWRQYFQYGFYKVAVIRKRKAVASIRHLVPAAFVLALIAGVVCLATASALPLLLLVAIYLVAALVASLLCAPWSPKYWPVLPFVFGLIHLGYGLGFLAGILRGLSSRASRTA